MCKAGALDTIRDCYAWDLDLHLELRNVDGLTILYFFALVAINKLLRAQIFALSEERLRLRLVEQ